MEECYSFSDLFQVVKCKDPFPFNLKFDLTEFAKRNPSELNGKGIYIISFNDELIYIGKYLPTGGNIARQRWVHHVSTFTGRGYRVGFGSIKRWQDVFKNLYSNFAFTPKIIEGRLKDTGTVTSKNRVVFSMINWKNFKGDFQQVDFKFHYFKSSSINKKKIDSIEKELILKFNPCGNFQFKESEKELHSLKSVLNYTRKLINLGNK